MEIQKIFSDTTGEERLYSVLMNEDELYLFSELKEEKGDNLDKGLAIGSLGVAGIGASKIKTGRLTGKVTRYHNTKTENIKDILENGLKAKYAEDPNNITNKALPDVPMEEKKNLVYTSKKKGLANRVGIQREIFDSGNNDPIEIIKGRLGKSKKHKTLKLEFDYDELKGKEKIANPELRGAKTAEEFYNKTTKNQWLAKEWKDLNSAEKKVVNNTFKELGEKGTHIFKGDIDSKYIVGGKGYQKRSLSQIRKYIKNNPGRFGKEAAKVTAIGTVGAYGVKKGIDVMKNNKKE